MNDLTRRNFMSDAAACATLATLTSSAQATERVMTHSSSGVSVAIPMPIQVVIDDVGWWSGKDGSKQQEPFRTGFNRDQTVDDYRAIVALGKALNIRPMAATVLCEWDRHNLLQKYPNVTWMGKQWDNSRWVGPWLDEAADVIRNNQKHYELTIHGVGHEFWPKALKGKFTRAEWATLDGTMRPRKDIEEHLDCYERILDQNGLGPFPKSFVPACFNHGFDRTGEHDVSMAELLSARGVSHINTPFSNMQNAKKVPNSLFGLDSDVMTVDRGSDIFDWNVHSTAPEGVLHGPTCGMHWPNLLHENVERNGEIVDAWVKLLRPYGIRQESLLAKDSQSFQQQLAHHVCSTIKLADNAFELDFSTTDTLGSTLEGKELTIKVKTPFQNAVFL